MAGPRGGYGRPSKGRRDAFMVRPAQPVGDAIRVQAAQQGYSLSSYISKMLAEALEMPQHAPTPDLPPRVNDEEQLFEKTAS